MTRNRLILVLGILAVLVTFIVEATTYTVWTGSPSGQSTGKSSMFGYPKEPLTWATTSVSGSASTSTIIVTRLAGSKKVTVFMDDSGAAGVCWILPGSTAATIGTGIPIYNLATLAGITSPTASLRSSYTFDIDAGVPLSYKCTTTASITVLQTGQLTGE